MTIDMGCSEKEQASDQLLNGGYPFLDMHRHSEHISTADMGYVVSTASALCYLATRHVSDSRSSLVLSSSLMEAWS